MWEDLAAEARRLRKEESLSVRQIQQRLGVSRHRLYEWMRGVPAPKWTNRPNAKDELRAAAQRLRQDGTSVPEIAIELGVAKSTAFQWTREIALDPDSERSRQRRERSKRMTDAYWASHRSAKAAERDAVTEAGAKWVGELTERELLLVGAVAYWCEGAKTKPWGSESADVAGATQWWAAQVGVSPDSFQRPTLKRHNPMTKRHNVGDNYRGCLVITVPRGRVHYWRIEGIMRGLARCRA